jgi:hypothetical protein
MHLECRAFSAQYLSAFNPGLTAGPIFFRPFGPDYPNLDCNDGF